MRDLTPAQKARASESLGLAYSHLRVAEVMIENREWAHSLTDLYYVAFFCAKAACVEVGHHSDTHRHWKSRFNECFGRGKGWVPKSYVKLFNRLYDLRNAADYEGTVENNEHAARSYLRQVKRLLKKVRSETPLLLYPEYIQGFLAVHSDLRAVEFDYYCPASYIHKERIQFQLQAKLFTARTIRKLVSIGGSAVRALHAKRECDYVVGWNNRLAQSGDAYLLFLDIDETDEGRVKHALRNRRGHLFKTGAGYHFVGSEVYPSREMWLHRYRQAVNSRELSTIVDKKRKLP